jgi:hypothetical protein
MKNSPNPLTVEVVSSTLTGQITPTQGVNDHDVLPGNSQGEKVMNYLPSQLQTLSPEICQRSRNGVLAWVILCANP